VWVFDSGEIKLGEAMMEKEGVNVFLSYSHADQAWVDQLTALLTALKWRREIQDWSEYRIEAGTDWKGAIVPYLNTADIILFLLSPDFLASAFAYSEAQRAFERAKSGHVRLIPVLLRPVVLEGTPFAKLRTAPSNGIPITRWENTDGAFLSVTQEIRNAVKELTVQAATNDA
jgi:TIR domain